MKYELRINDTVLKEHLNNPKDRFVGKRLRTQARLALAAAKQQVGVKTGALKRSIYMNHTREVYGQRVVIGARSPIARIHHEGTKPHTIMANNHHVLKFTSKSQVIYVRTVRHPGTKPNRFLSDQLKFFIQ